MDGWQWTGWITAAALAGLGAWLLFRGLVLDRSRGRRRCPKCWYDMAGVAGLRCPECGREARAERQLLRTRRHKRVAALGLSLLLLAAAAAHAPRVARQGWLASTPTPVLLVILSVWDDEGGDLYKQTRGRMWTVTGAVGLSDWEQLLLARYCGRKLREALANSAAAAQGPSAGAFSAQASVTVNANGASVATIPFPGMSPTFEYLMILDALGSNARPAIPALILALRTGDGLDRTTAAEVLGGMGHAARPAIPSLIEMLEPPDTPDARLALRVLGSLAAAAEPAADDIGRFIDNARAPHAARLRAIAAVGAMGPAGRAALPAVLRVAEGPDPLTTRLLAVRAAGLVGVPTPDAVRILAARLAEDDPAMRNAAARALEQFGPRAAAAMPALEALLADDHEYIREAAADALRAIRAR